MDIKSQAGRRYLEILLSLHPDPVLLDRMIDMADEDQARDFAVWGWRQGGQYRRRHGWCYRGKHRKGLAFPSRTCHT